MVHVRSFSVGCGEAVARCLFRYFQITIPHHYVRETQPIDRETHHGLRLERVEGRKLRVEQGRAKALIQAMAVGLARVRLRLTAKRNRCSWPLCVIVLRIGMQMLFYFPLCPINSLRAKGSPREILHKPFLEVATRPSVGLNRWFRHPRRQAHPKSANNYRSVADLTTHQPQHP